MAEASAPQLVRLELLSPADDILEIQYRGAVVKLPSGVDMDAVTALLRSIQSLHIACDNTDLRLGVDGLAAVVQL